MDKEVKNGWIPVSEGLPEDFDEIIVTWVNRNPPSYYKNIKDKPFVDFAVFYRGKWCWWSDTMADLLKEYGAIAVEDFEIEEDIEITAWMPMPEPYKEDRMTEETFEKLMSL